MRNSRGDKTLIVLGDSLAKSDKEKVFIQMPPQYNFSTDLLLHGYNVGVISREIAKEVGLENYNDMILIGILHDIGKSKIPSEILFKPTKLTPSEFSVMKKHAIYSEEFTLFIMGNTKISRYYAKVIRHHHENCNGIGYPDGLKGNSIPTESKILAISDVFDAMIQPRIYRPYPVVNPIELMEKEGEEKFDKELFEIAKPILEKWYKQKKCNSNDL